MIDIKKIMEELEKKKHTRYVFNSRTQEWQYIDVVELDYVRELLEL